MLLQRAGHPERVGEVADQVRAADGEHGHHHDRDGPDHHDDGADGGVGPLVADEPGRDALVDDVGLLEEQLPGRHRGAHDRDDEQDRGGAGAPRDRRNHEMVANLAPVRVRGERQRVEHQAGRDEQEDGPFPPAEATTGGHADQQHGGERYRDEGRDAEVPQREGHADELGDNGQEVEQEQVADTEPAPEPAEPLVDQAGVPDAGHRAEPDHHLLVDDEHRDEQQQHPEQAVPVVLAGLCVGGDAAGVVVSHHDDQAGAHDGQEGDQLAAHPPAAAVIVDPDPAQRALDVAEMRLVQHRAAGRNQRRDGVGGRGVGRGSMGWLLPGMADRGVLPPGMADPGVLLPGLANFGVLPPGLAQHGVLSRGARSPGRPHCGVPRCASGGWAVSRRRQSSGSVASSTSSTVIRPIIRRSSSTTGIVIRL